MSANSFAPAPRVFSRYRFLLFAAVLFTFLLVVMGTIGRVGISGQACPDWPTCYGSFALPSGDAARLHVAHRALAALAGLVTWAAAGWAALKLRRQALVSLPVIATALIMLAQVLLGGEMVLGSRLPVQALQPVHMLLAVFALGLLSAAALAAFLGHANPSLPTRLVAAHTVRPPGAGRRGGTLHLDAQRGSRHCVRCRRGLFDLAALPG